MENRSVSVECRRAKVVLFCCRQLNGNWKHCTHKGCSYLGVVVDSLVFGRPLVVGPS